MSTYKSYTPRRPSELTHAPSNDKLKEKIEKLQELFPNWSHEDLQSVLTETVGDVELAVTRISEGHAEQWVTREKKKKVSQPPQSGSSFSTRGDRDRTSGDIRGGRGGGRGGRGRGAGSRGASRAAHASHQHRDNGASATNGITAVTPAAVPTSATEAVNTADSIKEPHVETKTNGVNDGVKISTEDSQALTGDTRAQGGSDTPIAPLSVGKAMEHLTDTKSSTLAQSNPPEAAKIKAQVKTSTIPPGAKRSWAQIARPNEKPKPTPPTNSVPLLPPIAPAEVTQSIEEPTTAHDQQDIEEPTTVQPPTFDDEPSTQPLQAAEPQISTTHDGWITSENIAPPPAASQEQWETLPDAGTQDSNWKAPQPEESTAASSPQTATPSVASLAPISSAASVATSTAPTSKPSTPSVVSARPSSVHRTSARYPKSDQAVVIPAFAGSIGGSGEKLGMQFGSLSIGGDDTFDGAFKHDTEPATTADPEQPPAAQSQPTQAIVQGQSHESVPSPVIPVPTHNQNFFQQAQPTTSTPAQTQSIQSQVPAQQPTSSGPPFGSHPPPPALTHQQQQQQLAQHHQPQQHTYGQQQQQHGIHAHFDGPPAAQQQQPQTQHASAPQTGSYFRQPESPYYHNPTPPQTAPTDHQGAYGTTFSPLGVGAGAHAHAQSLGAQGQGSHLGGFGAGGPGEYGYGDGQRGFYDYAQPSGFGRSLVHDEPTKGGLPLSQGNQPSSSLASATGQPQSSSGPQGSTAQPPANQQAQQQGYPAPIPYYYPPYYPQNTYPTYPNPSYGQAYMPKYPPVYPHQAPVGPGSAPPPTGKGPNANAPYNATASQSHLYHGQGGFEDPNATYQHHQGSTNLGSADYQKQGPHHQQQQQPLYGTQGNQGLQSFLGIQQASNTGQGVGGPGGQQRSSTSPETTYKPYGAPGGASDKSGVGISAQPGQQGRTAGVQQSQQQVGGAGSFYPGGRFSGGGPQQQGQQQSQGYPQSGDQGQFYPYQPRHQGGYWQ